MTPPAPAENEEPKKEEDGAEESARAVRWVTASKDARDAIKWLATAIGAAAAALDTPTPRAGSSPASTW